MIKRNIVLYFFSYSFMKFHVHNINAPKRLCDSRFNMHQLIKTDYNDYGITQTIIINDLKRNVVVAVLLTFWIAWPNNKHTYLEKVGFEVGMF